MARLPREEAGIVRMKIKVRFWTPGKLTLIMNFLFPMYNSVVLSTFSVTWSIYEHFRHLHSPISSNSSSIRALASLILNVPNHTF